MLRLGFSRLETGARFTQSTNAKQSCAQVLNSARQSKATTRQLTAAQVSCPPHRTSCRPRTTHFTRILTFFFASAQPMSGSLVLPAASNGPRQTHGLSLETHGKLAHPISRSRPPERPFSTSLLGHRTPRGNLQLQ